MNKILRKTGIVLSFLLITTIPGFGLNIDSVLDIESALGTPLDQSNHPAELAVDDSITSYWAIQDSESNGQIILDLKERSKVHALRVEGNFPLGSVLQLQYKDNAGVFQIFTSAIALDLTHGNGFFDITLDNVVADELKLLINKPIGSSISVQNITFYGLKEEDRRIKKEVEGVYASKNSSYFANEYQLIDNNPETKWLLDTKAIERPVPNNVIDVIENNYDLKRYRANKGQGFVGFYLNPANSINGIKLYELSVLEGSYLIEYRIGSRWYVLTSQETITETGWKEFPIDEVGIEEVRITIENWKDSIAPFSEIEFWGLGQDSDTDKVELCLPYTPGNEIQIANYGAFDWPAEESTPPELLIGVKSTEGINSKVIINSSTEIEPQVYHFPGYDLLRVKMDEITLWDGANFFEIPEVDSSSILGQWAIYKKDIGLAPASDNLLLDHSLYTKSGIAGNYTLSLSTPWQTDKIELFSQNPGNATLWNNNAGQLHQITHPSWINGIQTFDTNLNIDSLYIENLNGEEGEIRFWGSPLPDNRSDFEVLFPRSGDTLKGLAPVDAGITGIVDNSVSSIIVNGIPAEVYENFFWVALNDLNLDSSDTITFTVEATSITGEVVKSTYVLVDERGYQITLTTPEYIETSMPFVQITGEASRNKVQLFIDGMEYPIQSNSTFDHSIVIESLGFNPVYIEFKDKKTGQTVKQYIVKVYKVDGSIDLQIVQPQDNYLTQNASISVEGFVQGLGPVSVTVNGIAASVDGIRFICPSVPLLEGENVLEIKAKTENGTEKINTIRVIRDNTAPRITTVFPDENSLQISNNITVTGTVDEINPYIVLINGVAATVDGSGFSSEIPLPDGVHPIVIEAIDYAGNHSSVYTRTVMVDTTPPDPEQFQLSIEPYTWTNNVNPTLYFNGVDEVSGVDHYEVAIGDGEFYAVNSPYITPDLPEGITPIRVRIYDVAGWYTQKMENAYIDITPPPMPTGYNLIPGDGQVELLWEETAEDIEYYKLVRTPAWSSGNEKQLTEAGFIDEDVINGQTYSYSVAAVDLAGNQSDFTEVRIAVSGLEKETILSNENTVAKYDGVLIALPPHQVPEGTTELLISKIESQDLRDLCDTQIIGDIYDIRVVDALGEEVRPFDLDEPYSGAIQYDESSLPEEFDEQDLSVFVYDSVWGNWSKLPNSLVDTENNTVFFTSHHFSYYSVQPSVMTEMSASELQQLGSSLSSSTIQHSPLSVSPESGTVSTAMTELVLPGLNGFDLEIKRQYSQGLAKQEVMQTQNYVFNIGDYAYKVADGWRLKL